MRMRLLAPFVLSAACAAAVANEQDSQREIQRSVIQRDQQSAEFAARIRGADTTRLEQLHARQLAETLRPQGLPSELHPYQRQKMADERALVLPPPTVVVKAPEKPLPLPGGPRHGVDPIPLQGYGN